MNNELLKAIQLRENGMLKEANSLLLELVHTYPSDAEIHYHCAWSFDVLGEETKAVPYYEKAIALGLSDDALQGALLGLGSTYRTIGDYVSSKRVLKKALEQFPSNRAYHVFYAMTLYNLHEHAKAMELLLNNIADCTTDSNIKSYDKAIRFYADKLDTVWK